MSANETVAVLGAGSWGTALAKVVADEGYETRLWARRAKHAAAIQNSRQNERYLPGFELPDTLTATGDLEATLDGASAVVVVVPTHGLRDILGRAVPLFPANVPIVSATKGIEQGTLKLVSEMFEELTPEPMHANLAYLGGPSFAKEVAGGHPTAVSVASRMPRTRERVQALYGTKRFRVYTTEDVEGIELGGALKNVIAIAAGVADGAGVVHNTRAGLITRGLAEISRLAIKLGANPLTLAGLSGMGDLVLTCTGDLSRNRRVGNMLGEGQKLPEILAGMNMVAEGVRTSKSAHELAQREGVDMPITAEVYAMLYEDKSPEAVVESLMARPMRHERA